MIGQNSSITSGHEFCIILHTRDQHSISLRLFPFSMAHECLPASQCFNPNVYVDVNMPGMKGDFYFSQESTSVLKKPILSYLPRMKWLVALPIYISPSNYFVQVFQFTFSFSRLLKLRTASSGVWLIF